MAHLFLQTVSDTATQQNFNEIMRKWPVPLMGKGSPNTVVLAGPGATYVDLLTGKLWVHEDPAVSKINWAVK